MTCHPHPMAFAAVQVSTPRFVDQEIKALKVLCRAPVQEEGDATVPAPAGLTDIAAVTVTPVGPPEVRSVTVLPGKAVNQGVVPVQVSVAGVVVIQRLEVPFQGTFDCPGAQPGDVVQKHDLRVAGIDVALVQVLGPDGITQIPSLRIKVVVRACVIVAHEALFLVSAAELFC